MQWRKVTTPVKVAGHVGVGAAMTVLFGLWGATTSQASPKAAAAPHPCACKGPGTLEGDKAGAAKPTAPKSWESVAKQFKPAPAPKPAKPAPKADKAAPERKQPTQSRPERDDSKDTRKEPERDDRHDEDRDDDKRRDDNDQHDESRDDDRRDANRNNDDHRDEDRDDDEERRDRDRRDDDRQDDDRRDRDHQDDRQDGDKGERADESDNDSADADEVDERAGEAEETLEEPDLDEPADEPQVPEPAVVESPAVAPQPSPLPEPQAVKLRAAAAPAVFRTSSRTPKPRTTLASAGQPAPPPEPVVEQGADLPQAQFANGTSLVVIGDEHYLNGVLLPKTIGPQTSDGLAIDFDNWLGEWAGSILWKGLEGRDDAAEILLREYCTDRPAACGPDLAAQLTAVAPGVPVRVYESGLGGILKPVARALSFGAKVPNLSELAKAGTVARIGDFGTQTDALLHFAKHVKGVQISKKTGKTVAKKGGADMPEFLNFAEYRTAARSMMGAGRPNGVLEAFRANGDVLRVNPQTGYFGIRTKEGVIRTFFRPDGDPLAYFIKEATTP
ncbi:hypothetical protein [Amycolatopsis magusensis]|uniref:Uncharacterized protein n=1 Tax=Amycolatopsis magusensis TaxID=882444 RepID=A0ABS4Q1G0_9PSEU|nr:hypothetical protein [Amycolatopsis magusensis]MBP2185506.1 hypothetical protein [Amycolatopsis magusensis]